MNAPISRRSALRTFAGGATAACLATAPAARLFAADSAPQLKERINHSVCKSAYPKASLDDPCKAAKASRHHVH